MIIKTYKPEITWCPYCNSKLVYKHTLSDKIIQFSDGGKVMVKNLGYKCANDLCTHKHIVYRSQTASKLCIKGYTYSSKILGLIYCYKLRHYSRDKICDIFSNNQIEISDRNIDLIYNKYKKMLNIDYNKIRQEAYNEMLNKYGEIRVSIDFTAVLDYSIITIRSFYNSDVIGLFCEKRENYSIIEGIINSYVDNESITNISTIRSFSQSFKYIKKAASSNVKFTYFEKV